MAMFDPKIAAAAGKKDLEAAKLAGALRSERGLGLAMVPELNTEQCLGTNGLN